MRVINIDKLEWFRVKLQGQDEYCILIYKPHINDLDWFEAEPVRHAKWVHKYYPTVWYGSGEPPEWVCSECEDRAYNTYDYCPNCGAKMDLEE